MAGANIFKLEVITPDRIFYTGEAQMVELTTTEGDVGIYAEHIPMTAIVAPGILTITESKDSVKEASLLEGFIEIMPDQITILAQSCEWPDEIDEKRAQKARERAERRLQHADDRINIARAELALKKSIIRLGLSQSGRKE